MFGLNIFNVLNILLKFKLFRCLKYFNLNINQKYYLICIIKLKKLYPIF